MKFVSDKLNFPRQRSFTVQPGALETGMYSAFQSHAGFAIILIENCTGKRFIGDHVGDIDGTELVLIADYLPHRWQYNGFLHDTAQPDKTLVHFAPDFFGNDMFEKPETRRLKWLFANAARGIRFEGETISKAKMILQQLHFEKGLSRFVRKLQLLDILAQADAYQLLSSPGFAISENRNEANRINPVFDHIFKNFQNSITLNEVAAMIPMSTAAFCRFFKSKTGATLKGFIKEVRIGNATKLLLEKKYNVAEACYNSGYNNISNFNKHFKEVKGISPTNFLRQYAS